MPYDVFRCGLRLLKYADHHIELAPHEGLVVITDGLPEMTDPAGAFYTLDRVRADLTALGPAAPQHIPAALAANALSLAAGTPAADDVTVLALRLG